MRKNLNIFRIELFRISLKAGAFFSIGYSYFFQHISAFSGIFFKTSAEKLKNFIFELNTKKQIQQTSENPYVLSGFFNLIFIIERS